MQLRSESAIKRPPKPRLVEAGLVKVATAHNQAEAEFVQDLLSEEGLPSLLRRAPGFDVPDFLAAGPRDVLVGEALADRAREVLLEGALIPLPRDLQAAAVPPLRILAGELIAVAVVVAIIYIGTLVIG